MIYKKILLLMSIIKILLQFYFSILLASTIDISVKIKLLFKTILSKTKICWTQLSIK